MKLTAGELAGGTVLHGRTMLLGDALWCNWTLTGFTVRFRGSALRARVTVISNQMKGPMTPPEGAPIEYPCIGVKEEAGEDFLLRRSLEEDGAWVELFSGEAGEHTLRVVKLSENSRGKCGFYEIETDGEFLAPERKEILTVEMVGDSITCGYGNESDKPGFRTPEENGWLTYGARAAREIGAEVNCISISGGSVTAPKNLPFPAMLPGLADVYPYTDALLETVREQPDHKDWDFAANPRDAVVVNLGTNDGNMLSFGNQDPVEAMNGFREGYIAFLTDIRRLNGPKTKILCTLGCIDYFLWDEIRDAAEEYKRRTGDVQVYLYKFGKTRMFTEGMGADGHPSLKSHERMGHELAAALKKILNL